MATKCNRCGSENDVGRFCPACGLSQEAMPAPVDPFVGSTIAERYEIVELISAGGMGRVYRAKQSMLDREVAVKVIHPHLVTTEHVVARFLAEARMSSRLNHPNVVSIYDFGRTADHEGGHLFLVMELLTGRSLSSMIEAGESISMRRTAKIMRQILAALGEAHEIGITHRDVKPENVLIGQRRGESDHVKVIDFGIATSAGDPRLSQAGQLLGTPHYIAPETLAGRLSPSVDLYAAGILLFELLAGVVPFDADSLAAIFTKHTSAPRPDPRDIAPARNIPDAMAAIAVKAIQIDPAARYQSAEEFAAAIDGAAAATTSAPTPATGRARVSAAARVPGSSPGVTGSGERIADTMADMRAGLDARTSREPSTPNLSTVSPPVPPAREASSSRYSHEPESRIDTGGIIGRDEFLRKAFRQIEQRPDDAHVFWGRSGIGKTAILDRILVAARRKGMTVIRSAAPSPPRDEIGFSSLQMIIAALVGVPVTDPLLCSGRIARDELVAAQLVQLFDANNGCESSTRAPAERDAPAVLRWAAAHAVERVKSKRVLLALDDIDAIDGGSRWAVEDFLEGAAVAGLTIVMTSELPPEAGTERRIAATEVTGLSRLHALSLLATDVPLTRTDDDIEPLYLHHLRQWPEGFAAPESLAGLLEWQIRALPSVHRRILQVLSLLGGATRAELKGAVPNSREGVDATLSELASAGLVRVDGPWVAPAHTMYLRIAHETAPSALVSDVHRRAGDALAGRDDGLELRAFHAVRASVDAASLDLVARSAEIRANRGDHASVAALCIAVDLARAPVRESRAESVRAAWVRVVQIVSASLLALDRPAEAMSMLLDALEISSRPDTVRAKVLKQLATVEVYRDKKFEAERWRREALQVATECGDPALIAQIRSVETRVRTGPHRRVVFTATSQSVRPPATSNRSGG